MHHHKQIHGSVPVNQSQCHVIALTAGQTPFTPLPKKLDRITTTCLFMTAGFNTHSCLSGSYASPTVNHTLNRYKSFTVFLARR